ncbi:PAS domain-containing protein, partial [candidate division KSB1 bacterium]|nr:PAS domain-containing protein [candidate division KSB1 bacterium]
MRKSTQSSTTDKSSAFTSRFEALLAAIPDIIMEVDLNKVYKWANQAGLDFFGADVIGREASLFFADEQDTYDLVQSLFAGDENVFYLESWQRRQDGERRLLAWWCRALKDAHGEVQGAISTARDITEQRKTEEQLRMKNQLFINTIESLSHPFYVVDVNNYQITMANSATAAFGTLSIGTKCYALTHDRCQPCQGDEHICPLQEVKRTKKPVTLEHIHFDKYGNKRYVEIHGFPILDDENNV